MGLAFLSALVSEHQAPNVFLPSTMAEILQRTVQLRYMIPVMVPT